MYQPKKRLKYCNENDQTLSCHLISQPSLRTGPIAIRSAIRSTQIGKIRGPSQELAVEEIVHILVRAAESAKHDASPGSSSNISAEMFTRPPGETSMVHHSDLSRDGRWVLVVLMNSLGKLSQRRVVPFDGSGQEHLVGPKNAVCTTGAWSLDGKWVYVSAYTGGALHIWRQGFPDGEPEQVTSGPTEEEGISITSDGMSFITSVGNGHKTVWIHDKNGQRQMSSEGTAFHTTFSSDGAYLYYLKSAGGKGISEVWRTDLAKGQIFTEFLCLEYSHAEAACASLRGLCCPEM